MVRGFKILILFIVLGCSKKADSYVTEFKTALGAENTKTLSLLISDFEKGFLKTNYPDVSTETAYKKFITDIRDQNTKNPIGVSKKSRNLFNSSRLKEAIYEPPPDSVWIEGDVIMSIYKDTFGHVDTLETIMLQTKTFNLAYILKHKDSIIDVAYKTEDLKVFGQYFSALEKVKKSNKYIPGYLDYKQMSGGFISPQKIAEIMLKYDLDYSNYIIKSIVLFEFIY